MAVMISSFVNDMALNIVLNTSNSVFLLRSFDRLFKMQNIMRPKTEIFISHPCQIWNMDSMWSGY